MKRLAAYLLQGVLLFAPIVITVYIIYGVFSYIDFQVNSIILQLVGQTYPGLGIIAGVLLLILIGALGSVLVLDPLFSFLERLVLRVPLVRIVYTSTKDLFSAFVSDKRKFNKPVLVKMGTYSRFGFLTEEDMSRFGMEEMVAVYLPHSYAFSGQLIFVHQDAVRPLDLSSAEVMKFIVSGGVTTLDSGDEEVPA